MRPSLKKQKGRGREGRAFPHCAAAKPHCLVDPHDRYALFDQDNANANYASSITERMLPAGSLNQARLCLAIRTEAQPHPR